MSGKTAGTGRQYCEAADFSMWLDNKACPFVHQISGLNEKAAALRWGGQRAVVIVIRAICVPIHNGISRRRTSKMAAAGLFHSV